MPQLLMDPPTPILGWWEVKSAYLHGAPLKEICRQANLSKSSILRHAQEGHWREERAQLPALVKAQVLARWGQDAQQQAQELMITIARNVELVEGEMAKLEAKRQGKKRLQAMSQIQAILTQATQSLRLLMGSATERHEVVSLSQLVVELKAKGYGAPRQGVAGSRGKGPKEGTLSPTPSPTLPAPIPSSLPDGGSTGGRVFRDRTSIYGQLIEMGSSSQPQSFQGCNDKCSPSQDAK